MEERPLIFLDSGAYSAWAKKTEIDIQQYIQFIKDNEKYIDHYANLDVIGDPVATLNNQKLMESQGLKPLPCFHHGEDWSYLQNYIDNYEYIAIGGMAVGFTTEQRRDFLDMVWDRICDTPDRMPKCKVHGFGVTAFDILLRYPWWSVDSTSWVMTSRFGDIYVPRKSFGKYIYDKPPWKVCVSDRSPGVDEEGQHIRNFTEMERDIILEYIHGQGFTLGKSEFIKIEDWKTYKPGDNERWFGSDVDDTEDYSFDKNETSYRILERVIEIGLCNDHKKRDEMNIIYFKNLEESFPPWPWAFRKSKGAKTLITM